jgi:hypothetical protein
MTALAEAITRDILADRLLRSFRSTVPAAPTCFACGRSYSAGDGRLCSTRCRAAFDAGLPPYEATAAAYSLTPRGDGFAIECAGCRKTFIGRGLRCCSTECEGAYREREEIAATMAEVGMELPDAKRKCEQCSRDIPRYRGVGKARREVRKDARFCSPRCAQRAGVASRSTKADLSVIEARKRPSNGPSELPPEKPPVPPEAA